MVGRDGQGVEIVLKPCPLGTDIQEDIAIGWAWTTSPIVRVPIRSELANMRESSLPELWTGQANVEIWAKPVDFVFLKYLWKASAFMIQTW